MATVNDELVRNALRTVMDPELGANLVDLGMIRSIAIDRGQVKIGLVLTTPGCPLAGMMIQKARLAVARLPGVEKVDVDLLNERWEPPEGMEWGGWGGGGASGW